MKSRTSEKQIIAAEKDTETGQMGQQEQCCQQQGQNASETRCDQLEKENRRLKLIVADLTLRNEALKSVVAKK